MDLHKTKLFADSWNIAYRKKSSDIIHDKDSKFTVIENAPHSWAADPFIIEEKGRTYIFAELYGIVKGRGVIGYYELGTDSSKWKPVIIESWHLSYPHIYRDNKEIYIIPEANESETLYCYHAIKFPDRWEKLGLIRKNVRYVDTSLFTWNEKKMALTYKIADNDHYKLMLLDIAEPKNDKEIEISDIELRRPGGQMNSENQIRVAQNCLHGYGEGLIFYKYSISDDGRYSESEIERLSPYQLCYSKKMYLCGLHTYNTSEHYEVIDVKTREFNFVGFCERIKGKLKRELKK